MNVSCSDLADNYSALDKRRVGDMSYLTVYDYISRKRKRGAD
jgi:hypothetical protein